MADKPDIDAVLKERFLELPKVVQNSITSADVEKHLRELANTHKLHLDQWETLENEVLMTLYGITAVDELQANIQKHVGISDEIAKTLADDISKAVFEPIRKELERELDHPDAEAKKVSAMEGVRSDALKDSSSTGTTIALPEEFAPAAVVAATPPPPTLDKEVKHAPAPAGYKPGEVSAERKDVVDDPYREQPE